MPERPISRFIVSLAIIVLGAVAAWRLPLSFLPSWSFPELTVELRLPQVESLDVATRAYLEPIESAIRSLGGVRDMLGDVGGTGGRFRVRFAPGVRVETKAARLDSELESLRRRLPERARLEVEPVAGAGGEMSNLVWLDEAPNPRLLDALRALPEVQSLDVAGREETELRLRARSPSLDVGHLADAARRGPRRVAHLGGGRWLMLDAGRGALGARPVRAGSGRRASTLSSVADLDLRREPASWQAHLDGRPGRLLLISRRPEVSPLALGRAIRRTLEDFGESARFLVDEAEPLVILLQRLGLGLVGASLLFGLWGAWSAAGSGRAVPALIQATAPPLAAAAASGALALAGTFSEGDRTLDVTTLPPLAAAVAAALLVHALRIRRARAWWPPLWAALAAAAVPVAVVLAGGPVGALLARPAQTFALALAGAAPAVHLLPAPRGESSPRGLALLRWLLRRPAAVLLGLVAVGYGLVTLFGDALAPVSGRLSPATADVLISLRFTDESTIEENEETVDRAEALIAERPEVETSWSVLTRGRATVGLEVTAEEKAPARLYDLAARLELQLQPLGATVQARPLGVAGGDRPLSFDDRLIEPPEIDDYITRYRFLLRSPEPRALREALVRLEERVRRVRDLRDHVAIHPDWGPPEEQWQLVPRSTSQVDAGRLEAAAASIAERARLPAALPTLSLRGLSQAVQLRVVARDAPHEPWQAPELDAALGVRHAPGGGDDDGSGEEGDRFLAPSQLFELREVLGSPTLRRQRGSFVLPVVARFHRLTQGERPEIRNLLHGELRALRWPAGVDRQLPRLVPKRFSEERMRVIAIAAALPLLLLALAIARLDSLPLGLATALAPAAGLLASTPLLFASGGGADELTWLVLAGTLAAVWALAAEVASGVRVRRPSILAVAPGYRWLARRLPAFAVAALGWLVMLTLPTYGLSSDRHAWVTALRAGGLAGAFGVAGAVLLLPVLLRAADRLRFHDREAHRRLTHPPAWAGAGGEARLLLETRNLNKIYGNGFQALSRVDLHLEPGIIGLLGPNGAGKSTLLRCLCGLLEPTRGRVLFRGEAVTSLNLPRYRRLVGFLPQAFNAYEGATVEDFLDYWALEIGILDTKARRRELARVLEQVDLAAAGARRVRELSGGMRRRIGIARALLGSPPILIVDEPTTGLDVESRQRLRDSLLRAAGERIILFSTHIASDIATTAARILILDAGRLQFDGSPEALIDEAHGRVFERLLQDDELRAFSARFRVTTRVRTLAGIRVRAVATREQEIDGELVRPNLEEAYLAKLGQGTRAPGCERRVGSLLDLGL